MKNKYSSHNQSRHPEKYSTYPTLTEQQVKGNQLQFNLKNPEDNRLACKALRVILSSFLVIITLNSFSQDKLAANGYIKFLSMYYHPEVEIPGIDMNHLAASFIHNRLNFKWYASNSLTFALEARNRVIFGQLVKDYPGYKSTVDIDDGFFDLAATVVSTDSWFLHTFIDRAWVEYTKGNFQARFGRQRINWGINLVWNPNDIFNTFSYFDFDYEERPGTDALKLQYYTGMTSSAELVYKLGKDMDEMALAAMYRFSHWGYDFQFFGGWVGLDYVAGAGWAGDIKGAGFRGEVSYFTPRNDNSGSQEALVASTSADYTFKSSLYLHGGILFNSTGTTGNAGGRSFFEQDISAKMLSLAKYSLFGQVSFPFTPLFSGNFSGMFNPSDKSYYVGPALTYSLGDNLELMLTGQLFFGDPETEFGDYGQAIYGRLKWAF